MSVDLVKLVQINLSRWQPMRVLPPTIPLCGMVAMRLEKAKDRYETVAKVSGVPWWVIAVIHERESSQSWRRSLAQGDPWTIRSVHVPKGRGPFVSWEAAAIDALTQCPPFAARWADWSIGGALTLLESYNGLGYARRGLPSPYLWAGTNQYKAGKYVADGRFDPNAVDKQLGCAAMISFFSEFKGKIGVVSGNTPQES